MLAIGWSILRFLQRMQPTECERWARSSFHNTAFCIGSGLRLLKR
jgi:hypothetical protein